ncbi:homeodomain transcription factor [Mycena rebaudengoi]|nr:homeodomain transcription factor [Mycena rebaudengoi]
MRSLSRRSSSTSTSSDDLYAKIVTTHASSTRPAKRFSHAQNIILERLFLNNPRPSREERERFASSSAMEFKAVTIWFQTKRQSERSANRVSSRARDTTTTSDNHYTHSRGKSSSAHRSSSTATSASRRPSLDRVASRSELRVPAPRTPSRRHNPHAPLWANMASSPLGPPSSPPARDYVEFGQVQHTRTLEWACARSRLAGKREKGLPALQLDDGRDTDVEFDEAVTPSSASSAGDAHTSTIAGKTMRGEPDEETMRAALALCGLMSG